MKPTIYFRFEQIDLTKIEHSIRYYTEMSRLTIGNFMMEDQKGFRFSQVLDSFLYYYENNPTSEETIRFESVNSTNSNGYIIPVAVQYHPNDWTDMVNGIKDIKKKSIFELINIKYLRDMQEGNALLLIDQSVEGYSANWLWKWFHAKCKKYNLSPASIIYLTGDQSCSDCYKEWCEKNNPNEILKVIPSTSLSMYIKKHCLNNNIISNFDDLLEYKEKNADNLYLYDCINLRPRPQRVLNFINLINQGLLNYGNISMPYIDDWNMYIDLNNSDYFKKYNISIDEISKLKDKTPKKTKFTSFDNTSEYHNFVERVLFDLYRNSWVSLVTESSYFNYEYSVFISEKTFKPIACMQPFIILGSKNSLKYLKNLGYKTFHPYIDETYDTLDDKDRIVAISDAIKKIQSIDDKVKWYKSIRDIVEHNYNTFLKIGTELSLEHNEVRDYYFNYFGKTNV